MTRHTLLLICAVLALAAGAAAEPPRESEPKKANDPAAGQKAIPLSGKVKEVLASGGYTYVNLAQDGGSVWAVFPTTPVKVGQELTLIPGYEMRNFTSKTLNRTFDRLVFSAGPTEKPAVDPNLVKEAHKSRDAQPSPPPAASLPPGHPATPAPLPGAALVPPHSLPPAATAAVKVKKASGANAYTVKQLYDRRSALDNKRVVVRGKVVKINPGILKQCWIHLQDGSGTPGKPDNVLVTTTPSFNRKLPKVGDVVTATGVLHKDRDFGAGYRYVVIIDNTDYRMEPKGK